MPGPDAGAAPASIVLLSDGGENRPTNPSDPRGAYTSARLARQTGVQVSTISIGTPATAWLRSAVLVLTAAALAALTLHRRLPA
jgi:hypothetical protein